MSLTRISRKSIIEQSALGHREKIDEEDESSSESYDNVQGKSGRTEEPYTFRQNEKVIDS